MTTEDFNKLNKIKSGLYEFGLKDNLSSNANAYFPCKFIKVIDNEKGIIELFEPSIDEFHTVLLKNVVVYNKI